MSRCFIIAEIGVNHNGSIELAKKHIDAAIVGGADAAKFQSFKADSLATANAPKAEYQKRTTGNDQNQHTMLKKLELSEDQQNELARYCADKGIEFMSSPFDLDAVRYLTERMKVRRLKIPSGEITNAPLLVAAASKNIPVIISTGMSTMAEIEAALGALAFGFTTPPEKYSITKPSAAAFRAAYRSDAGQRALKEKVFILQCTTEYPAPYSAVHLKAMETIGREFGIPVGLSDHTVGIAVPIAAAALGAKVIEKHITLDKKLPGPDHAASLEPQELKAMIDGIRQAEAALGSSVKAPNDAEKGNIPIARKSIVAARAIREGEAFTMDALALKRPGTGLSPFHLYELLDRKAKRNYQPDEQIEL